jgi:hypothetical protein
MSGFVPPQYSFSKVCNIFDDGKIVINSRLGQNQEVVSLNQLSQKEVLLIDVFLEVAAKGIIDTYPTICDAGTNIINGFRHGKKIILDENRDCSSYMVNRTRTLPQLKEWATTYCGF